jgi:hypothetical protein
MRWPQAVPMAQAALPRPDVATGADEPVRLIVPYTDPATTRGALTAAAVLTRGLNASIVLVAVQVLPFPAPFYCPTSVQKHLEAQLAGLASGCPVAVEATVVLARDQEEGYLQVLHPGATVLIATRTRWWKTREEKLARTLTRAGCKIALVKLDNREFSNA